MGFDVISRSGCDVRVESADRSECRLRQTPCRRLPSGPVPHSSSQARRKSPSPRGTARQNPLRNSDINARFPSYPDIRGWPRRSPGHAMCQQNYRLRNAHHHIRFEPSNSISYGRFVSHRVKSPGPRCASRPSCRFTLRPSSCMVDEEHRPGASADPARARSDARAAHPKKTSTTHSRSLPRACARGGR